VKRPVPGHVGWLGLAGYVALWDLSHSTETLSSAFAPSNTHGRKIYVGAWLYLTLHLLRLLPERYDILRQLNRGAQ
jgi:hypothetical protein